MSKDYFLAKVLKIAHKLSPGFLILGISLIGWASYQIYTQSVPAAVSIVQPEEQPGAFAVVPESAGGAEEEATVIATKTAAQPEVKAEAGVKSDTEAKTENETASKVEEQTVLEPPTEVQTAAETTTQPKIATAPQTNDTSTQEILYPVRPTVGENIGNLTLPAINKVLPIVHGTDEDELSRGIGHFAGSVLPGEKDNSVLSGHRDTVFRELGQLDITDQLIVDTAAGTFTYEIRDIKIVPKDDKSIITPTSTAVLTVTTCYPFNFIGSAPDRYILIADLVSSE